MPYRLCRGPGSGVVVRRLGNLSTLGDVVSALVGQMVPVRASPDGRLAGWYRLGPQTGPLAASTRLDSIAPEDTLYFHAVAGRIVPLPVEATVDGRVLALTLPIHTAVPVVTLVDALCTMFSAPAGEWNLVLDGTQMDSSGILEDFALSADSSLRLVKT